MPSRSVRYGPERKQMEQQRGNKPGEDIPPGSEINFPG